jgi:hypothetical protein
VVGRAGSLGRTMQGHEARRHAVCAAVKHAHGGGGSCGVEEE